MLRALAVRQGIRVADFVLVALLGFVVYKVIILMMGLDGTTESATRETPDVVVNFSVDKVADRAAYNGIIESKLFGPAGEFGKPEMAETAPEFVETDNETNLPMILAGATATVGFPTDPSASALIENRAARTVEKQFTFWIDDEIMQGVTLLEVYPRRVKILNQNRVEWLSMADEDQSPRPTAARAMIQSPRAAQSEANPTDIENSKRLTLSKDETYEEMMQMDYAETVRQLRPRMEYDENDNVVGITSDYFSQIPLAEKTGFIDGDVITEVNGTPIDSQERVPDILIKEQNSTSIRIRFERNGVPMVRTIRLE